MAGCTERGAPNAAQVQLGMQLGPAANTKETEKG